MGQMSTRNFSFNGGGGGGGGAGASPGQTPGDCCLMFKDAPTAQRGT